MNNTDTFCLNGDLNELVSTKYDALAGTNMASAYSLPSDAQTSRGSYYALYNSVTGYRFHHWETSGDVTVSDINASQTVVAVNSLGGTIRAIYTFWSPCDIDQNLVVDMKDVGIAAKAAFTDPQDALWNPLADITGPAKLPDGKVNMMDIGIVARHFGDICS
jgi:hypothetical protein